MGLDAFGNAVDELAFPVRELNAGLVGRALGPLQGVDGLALGGLALGLERAGPRFLGFVRPGRARLLRPVGAASRGAEAGPLQDQISPIAER